MDHGGRQRLRRLQILRPIASLPVAQTNHANGFAGVDQGHPEEGCQLRMTCWHPAYTTWAEATGDKHPLAKGIFDERLRRLGRKQDRVRPDKRRETKQIRVWLGIRFKTTQDDDGTPCDKNDPCDSV